MASLNHEVIESLLAVVSGEHSSLSTHGLRLALFREGLSSSSTEFTALLDYIAGAGTARATEQDFASK